MIDDSLHPHLKAGITHSRYLRQLFSKHPQLIEEIADKVSQPFTKETMLRFFEDTQITQTEEQIAYHLRALRQKVMAHLICRELSGLADLTETMHTISDLAEISLSHSLASLSQPHERYGQPIGEYSGQIQELLIVAMGKLGGRELNVSSDIDLIFVYPEEGQTNGRSKISNHEYFSLIGKKLIQLLNNSTDMGFVFRVDMRLRPFGESGPLVTSFAALEHYLITQGREWERYAWIKARVLNDTDYGLIKLIQPFVYRRYLDYGAYASMRDLHQEIRKAVSLKGSHSNIKIGPGGIREIEFIGQVFQLIRGGRTPELQIRPTQATLKKLDELGILPSTTVDELQSAYIFLRRLEHRLQYLDDAQTHDLPSSIEDQCQIAYSMGFNTYEKLLSALTEHRHKVNHHFEETFILPEIPESQAVKTKDSVWLHLEDQNTAETLLTSLGYHDTNSTYQLLKTLALNPRYLGLSERSKKRMDHLLPLLLEVVVTLPNPDITLQRIVNLLETICRRDAYLALLAEHPYTLKSLATIYSKSPWVSEYLTQHPILLDELLDPNLLYQPLNWLNVKSEFEQQLQQHQNDNEAQIDALRDFQHKQIFRLLAQDLGNLYTVETMSDHLSDLADACLQSILIPAWQTLKQKHQPIPKFAMIAYGKLGGKELGYASDLDLVFLYDDPQEGLDEIYVRFAKRIVHWLTTTTSAGKLYDIDLRLRPNGASGLLVSSFAAFQSYQLSTAWLWEHQALTRARFVAGDPQIKSKFEALRKKILRLERDIDPLKKEIFSMRQKMVQTHPRQTHNVKHCYGGLIDIEFIVQYLVLAHAHNIPEFTQNSGNIALLATAAQHGLIDPTLADITRSTYRQLRHIQHTEQLHGYTNPENSIPIAICSQSGPVGQLWSAIFGEPLP